MCVQAKHPPAHCFDAGKIVAQHVELEKQINIVEACAINHNPDWRHYWPFIQCMEEKYALNASDTCAQSAGLDSGAINTCVAGSQGEEIEAEMAKATPDHPGVPYILVDGKPCDAEDLLATICSTYSGPKPHGCKTVTWSWSRLVTYFI